MNTVESRGTFRLVVVLGCLLVVAFAAHARSQTSPLTNEDIIELVEAGLGAGALVAAIERAEAVAFDVDAGLLHLARSGVPDEVITAMIEKQSERDDAVSAAASAAEQVAPTPGIYLVDQDVEVRLEPTAYSFHGASRWRSRLTLGIARGQARATVPRERSQARTPEARPRFRFVFPANPNQFALARMEPKEGRRELVVGEANEFGFSSGPRGQDMRAFEFNEVEPGIYEVEVTQDLSAGEFCFFPILAGNVSGDMGGAAVNQIFDFGVGP